MSKCCGRFFCQHKAVWAIIIAGIAAFVYLASTSWAHAGTANFEPTYRTVQMYKPVTECRMVGGSADTGDLIVGGLLGSAIGNGLTSQDGAGTLGAVLGALAANENAKPRQVCNTRQVPNGTYQELTGYNVWIDGSQYWVPAK